MWHLVTKVYDCLNFKKMAFYVCSKYLNVFISFFSREFRNDFLELLRRRFGKHLKYFINNNFIIVWSFFRLNSVTFFFQALRESTTTLSTMNTSATESTSIWMPLSGRRWPTSPSGWAERVRGEQWTGLPWLYFCERSHCRFLPDFMENKISRAIRKAGGEPTIP